MPVVRDERTLAVENASYRFAYLVLSYGLLISTAYRGFVRDEPAWDLLALVVFGGVVTASYQASKRVLTRKWLLTSAGAVVLAVILAAAIVLVAR
jgi:hypothetical protein